MNKTFNTGDIVKRNNSDYEGRIILGQANGGYYFASVDLTQKDLDISYIPTNAFFLYNSFHTNYTKVGEFRSKAKLITVFTEVIQITNDALSQARHLIHEKLKEEDFDIFKINTEELKTD